MLRKTTLFTWFLLSLLSVISYSSFAGSLYWVDNSGNWNDAKHWSLTSGGKGGAGIPNSTDDVFFDDNSFTKPNQQVTIVSTASCHTLDVLHNVASYTLAGSTSSSLDVYGSLLIDGAVENKFQGAINFKSAQQGNIISAILKLQTVNFDGSGSWKMNSLLFAGSINLSSGELVSNGFEIACDNFEISGYSHKKLDVSNSMLYIEKQFSQQNSGGFHLASSNSKFYFEHYPVSGLATMVHGTHHVTSVDSSHYGQTNLTCNTSDSLGGGLAPCDGKAWITNIYANDGGPFSINWEGWTHFSANGDTAYNLCNGNVPYQIYDSSDNSLSGVNLIIITAPVRLNISYSSRPPRCFGYCDAWIRYDIQGGTPSYAYSWSNGPAGLSPGGSGSQLYDSSLCGGGKKYKIHIQDAAGCHNTPSSITIGSVSPVMVQDTFTPPSCSYGCNATATANPSGGHPLTTYTYSWSTSPVQTTNPATNLCPGSYTVTVKDDSGCVAKDSVTIKAPPVISIVATSTDVTCSGLCNGQAKAAASGGSGTFTYLWTPSGQTTQLAVGLCAGNYKVVVTDSHGCKDSVPITIFQPNPLAITSMTANPNPLTCGGDCNASIVTSVNGGTKPYSFSWSNGVTTQPISGLCAGSYTLTVTDAHGCTTKDSVIITQPVPVTVKIISKISPTCHGSCNGSISVTGNGGTSPYTYSWSSGPSTSSINNLCAGTYKVTVTDKNGCSDTASITLTQPPATTIILKVDGVTCNGSCDGKAFATPSGGTPPYTYKWNITPAGTTDSVTGLCPTTSGPDSLIITDGAGCRVTDYFNVNQPTPLSTIVSSNNSSCTICNGSAKVAVGGGTPPYTYSWNTIPVQTTDSATGLCAGNYTVTVYDADSCKIFQPVTIVPTVKITITSTATGLSCFGSCNGTATANVKGGTKPYTFNWMPGGQTDSTAIGLCAGTYTITVHDFIGCSNVDSVTFTNPPQITDSITHTNISCSGACVGTAKVVTTGGGTPPYTYSWSSGVTSTTTSASGLCQGTYTITIKDANNCTHQDTVTIKQAPAISPHPTDVEATCSKNNGSITLNPTGGIGKYTYLWNSGATTSSLTNLFAGTYTVTITDSLGCSGTFPIALSDSTGPVLGSTVIASQCWNVCNGSDSVFVVSGTSPYSWLWSTGATSSSISHLCPGSYACAVTDGHGCITTETDSIKQPSPIHPNYSFTNITCKGSKNGTIQFLPFGGNAGAYTYIWSPSVSITNSATNLGPGTYNITITDSKGCDTAVSITITEPPLLTASISDTNVTCNGDGNGIAVGSGSGGTSPYSYSWSNGGVTPKIINLIPGNYTFTVTDANGCTATDNVTITQPLVLKGTMGSTNVSCWNGSNGTAWVVPTGGTKSYTYHWNNSDVTDTIKSISAGKYIVTVTDSNKCTFIDSVTITQPTGINIGILSSTNATCNGDCDGIVNPTISGGTSPYTYLWSNGKTTSTDSTLCAGVASITVTDADHCFETYTLTLTQPGPIASNANGSNISCTGKCDGKAWATPSGGTGPYTYLWSNSATSDTIGSLCAGTYTVIVHDSKMCTDTAIVKITTPPAILISASTSASNCGVCNGLITISAGGGTPPYSYGWSVGGTTDSVTNACAGIYTYTVTDSKGCTASSAAILNNTGGPTGVTLTQSNDSCFGECDGIIIIPPVGGTPPFTYTFNSGPVQTTDTARKLCSGFITFAVTDSNKCKFTDTTTITQPTLLTATSVVTNATCVGKCDGTINITASGGTPPYSYKWSVGISSTTSSANAVCVGIDTITITDAHKCTFLEIDTIKAILSVHSVITSTNPLCHDSCTGTSTPTLVTGGTSPYTYSWSNGKITPGITNLCAGNYTLTVTDAKGCQAFDTAFITQPNALSVVFTSTPVSCTNSCDGKIVATVSGGTKPYNYTWNNGQTTDSLVNACPVGDTLKVSDNNGCKFDSTIMLFNPPVINIINNATNATCNTTNDGSIDALVSGGVLPFTYSWSPGGETTALITNLLPGKYILTVTDSTHCEITDTVVIVADTTVIANPGKDTSICALTSVTLNGSASINAIHYEWFAPPRTLIGISSTVTVTPSATTTYLLVATDGICRDSASVTVNINPLPVINPGSTQNAFVGSSVTLGGTPTAAAGSTFLWQPSAGMNDSVLSNPVVTPSVTTVYTVTVTSPFGCTDTASETVIVLPQFSPPSGFTPNGDGINDYWNLNQLNTFPNLTVEIFNRWGERVYHSDGYKIPWDGTYNKDPLPVGTYYYIITLNDPRFPKPFTGPVTIMR